MNLNGWEHDELKFKISDLNVFDLLQLYKEKNNAFNKECVILLHLDKETEEGIIQHSKCKTLDEEIVIIAKSIANRMAGI